MNNFLKDTLQVASYYLNNELVSSKALLQMNEIANFIPTLPAISEVFFECHLGSYISRTDLSIPFTSSNQGKEALTSFREPQANLLSANPVWNRIQDFCVHWTDKKSPLFKHIKHIWLEFDLEGQSLEVPEPSLFFAPQVIKREEERLFLPNDSYHQNNWISNEALRLLFGNSLSKQVEKQLLTCFNLLPPSAKVYQIGVMLPRASESQAVRLCVDGLMQEHILEYLKNIGWSGSITQLNFILSELYSLVDFITLTFSFEDNVFPKLGFECFFSDSNPNMLLKLKAFLNYLFEQNLCNSEEVNALLNWSGYSTENFNQERVTSKFAKASAFFGASFVSTYIRQLNHIKLVYLPNKIIQAKAYLWFGHRWLSR